MEKLYRLSTFGTPLGPITSVSDSTGALTHLGFGDGQEWAEKSTWEAAPHDELERQIGEYFDGKRQTFDLPLAPNGTAWQKRVWAELQTIPFGQTTTYGQIAARLGNPNAARAVGRANATNPICLVIPCHRVLGAGKTLTGYAFGLERKKHLLALESAFDRQKAA